MLRVGLIPRIKINQWCNIEINGPSTLGNETLKKSIFKASREKNDKLGIFVNSNINTFFKDFTTDVCF